MALQKGGWRMYGPGVPEDFTLRAYPEVCAGTPESIEAIGRATARQSNIPFSSPRFRLIPEPVPLGTPDGWRGFRFTDSERVYLGSICGIVYDTETGRTVFVMTDIAQRPNSSSRSFTLRQGHGTLLESHVLIPPNGYVSPELMAGDTGNNDS
jgi:hypothetical protein